MKILISILLCFPLLVVTQTTGTEQPALETNIRAIAQVEEALDPNESLGLEKAVITILCNTAQVNSSQILKKVKNFSRFEESLFTVSKKKPVLIEAQNNNLEVDVSHKEEVAILWNSKYNQIYCPPGLGFSPDGYLVFISCHQSNI